MLTAILAMTGLATAFGLLLGYTSIRFRVEGDPIVDKIDAVLPQTQCGQCGFPGCRPYAEAIAAGQAPINKCPPGGESGVQALAELLGVDPLPLDAAMEEQPSMLARILEEDCIGCAKCIKVCPVDAILGTTKQMHTVIRSECTGCALCIPVCPVDCIRMEAIPQTLNTWCWPYPDHPEIAEPLPSSAQPDASEVT